MTIKRWRGPMAAACSILLVLSHPISAQAAGKKPNNLVILGDDIGGFNISACNQGIIGYKTPDIDRIAKEGHCSRTGKASKAALRGALR